MVACSALLTLASLFSHRRLVMGVLDSKPFLEYARMTTRHIKPLPGMTHWGQWAMGDFEFYCPYGEISRWWLIVPPWFACLLFGLLPAVHLGLYCRRTGLRNGGLRENQRGTQLVVIDKTLK